LRWNAIGSAGCESIATALQVNHSLLELLLCGYVSSCSRKLIRFTRCLMSILFVVQKQCT
jgi:hypothetical protein